MDADLDLHLREELAPDLEILRPLGRGSTATVYLARETALKRLVAVKVLRPEFSADDVARRRFEREAQSAARISHSNITPVHRIGRLRNGQPFMVMEYVDGRTLGDMIAARGPLPLDEVRHIIATVAAALASAHEKGIIHRDVRPGNVFVEDQTNRPVLADFGIAALLDSADANVTKLTAIGHRIGNVRYMSPEQIRGEPATAQSDVYALAILAYEAIAGQGPFDAAPATRMVTAHLTLPPRPLSELRPDVDAAFARVVERCLAKEPHRRPRARDIPALIRPGGPVPASAASEDAAPLSGLTGFLAELKRRRVYQVMVAYGTAAFIVLQGADLILPALSISARAYTVLVTVTLAGFPIALVLSWVYDITGGRLQRTRDLAAGEDQRTSRRLLPWIGLAASVVIAGLLWWWLT